MGHGSEPKPTGRWEGLRNPVGGTLEVGDGRCSAWILASQAAPIAALKEWLGVRVRERAECDGGSSRSSSLTQSPRFGEMRGLPGRRTDSKGYQDLGVLKLEQFEERASLRKKNTKGQVYHEAQGLERSLVNEGPGSEGLVPSGEPALVNMQQFCEHT